MNRVYFIFIISIIFIQILNSNSLDLNLKKDEEFTIKIKIQNNNKLSNIDKSLKLRWTLYKNDGLVLHLKYDHFVHQFILYKEYGLNQWSLNLSDTEGTERAQDQARIKIFFKNIDQPYSDQKAVASFRLYLEGPAVLTK